MQKPGSYKLNDNEVVAKALQIAKLKDNANIEKIDFNKKNIKALYVPYKNKKNMEFDNVKTIVNNYYFNEKNTYENSKNNIPVKSLPNNSYENTSAKAINKDNYTKLQNSQRIETSTQEKSSLSKSPQIIYKSSSLINSNQQIIPLSMEQKSNLLIQKIKEELFNKFLVLGEKNMEVVFNTTNSINSNNSKPNVQNTSKPEVVNNPKPNVQNTSKPEVVNNFKPNVQNTSKPEVVNNPKPNVQNTSKPEVVNNFKPNVQNTSKPEVVNNFKPNVQNTLKPVVLNDPKPNAVNNPKPNYGNKNEYFCEKYEAKIQENNKHKGSKDYVNANDFLLEPKNKEAKKTYNRFVELLSHYTELPNVNLYDRIGRFVYHSKNHHITSFCEIYLNQLFDTPDEYEMVTNFLQIY